MKRILFLMLILVLLFGWSLSKPALAATSSPQVTSSTDDVNEDASTFTTNGATLWLGNSSSSTSSYTGLRFSNVAIPNGATITSAKLKVYSSQSQWIGIRMNIAGELSPNSATFSSSSKPSQRSLTVQNVNHNSNASWSANTWYLLDEMAPVVQEIVNQAGWQSGNSLSIILKGTGSAYGRKFITGWDGSSANAPMLVVTYSSGDTPTATATFTQAPPTSTPPAATPTRTSTSIPPSATFTATSIPPTRTFTPTSMPPTNTSIPPSPTRTATQAPPTQTSIPPSPTPTSGPATTTSFSIGPGWADVIPHQIVRTIDDRLYYFGFSGDGSSVLNAYWTAVAGMPTKGSDFSGRMQVTASANILSAALVYDGSHIIHVLTNSLDGSITDRPFDTNTNQFKASKTLDTTGGKVTGYSIGTSGVTAVMDLSSVMHVAYWTSGNHIIYRSYTYNSTQDVLTLVEGPTQLDTNGSANHPVLAVSPLDGSLTAAWVSQATNPAKILARTKNSGVWGSVETVSAAAVWTSADSGINIDQGPSLIIGTNGTKYLAYIENWRVSSPYDYGRVHFVTASGSTWSDQYIGVYSHDPAVAINSAGQLYILGHGYPLNPVCTSIDDMCMYKRNSDGTWATPKLFLVHQGSQSFDDSPSVKWSVVGYNRPDTIEFVFSEVGSGYASPVLYYGRIGAN